MLERSATMGVIVAAPTAGSAGVVPGCVLALAERLQLDDEQIMDALYGDDPEPPASNMPSVWIHKLRRKLETTGVDILVVWGRGYQLTPAARELLRPRVAEAA